MLKLILADNQLFFARNRKVLAVEDEMRIVHRRKLPSRCSWRWTNSAPRPCCGRRLPVRLQRHCAGATRTRPESSSWLTPARALSAIWATEPMASSTGTSQSRSGRLRAQSSRGETWVQDVAVPANSPKTIWLGCGFATALLRRNSASSLDRSGIQEQRDRVTTWHTEQVIKNYCATSTTKSGCRIGWNWHCSRSITAS